MSKKLLYFIISLVTVAILGSCNKDSDSGVITSSSSTVVVSSFSLSKDEKVLTGLDSVFFSIDLTSARVFNADSLPYGTDVSRLVPKIGVEGCSVAELHFSRANKPDTVVNYLTNPTDSIDFSIGRVKLHLASANLEAERDYYISVNVHRMKPDSLYWNRTARRNLPTSIGIPGKQKTVVYKDHTVCLTASGTNYCIATADNPGDDNWTTQAVTFPFTPAVETLSATTDALYITDTAGKLYQSTDGAVWTDCNLTLHYIYGGYGNRLLAVEKRGTTYYHVTYPATTATAVPDGCPVEGTSQIATFTNEWSDRQQAYMLGGVTADGKLTGSMWGYDGRVWAKISQQEIPAGKGRTMFSYVTFKTDSTNWRTKAYTTLVALGGQNAAGVNDKTVYISLNMGLNWKKADALMQLPDYIPAMFDSQAIVANSTLTVNKASSHWEELSASPLPRWYRIAASPADGREPITEWECPYVYLFGGRSADGTLYNTVWRGVINRLSFKPLQ